MKSQKYIINYNDGVYYGVIIFKNKTKEEIEDYIRLEIERNNKNSNPLYHISRENFKLELN